MSLLMGGGTSERIFGPLLQDLTRLSPGSGVAWASGRATPTSRPTSLSGTAGLSRDSEVAPQDVGRRGQMAAPVDSPSGSNDSGPRLVSI